MNMHIILSCENVVLVTSLSLAVHKFFRVDMGAIFICAVSRATRENEGTLSLNWLAKYQFVVVYILR